MSEDIFRKKSIDKMQSPESLNDYVRVANPGVWLLLAAAIALLVGACVWGTFGYIDTVQTADVRVESGEVRCYLPADEASSIRGGMALEIEGVSGVITSMEGSGTETVYLASMDETLPDGTYTAQIVVERIHPITFVIN